jgi:hypothetical protein
MKTASKKKASRKTFIMNVPTVPSTKKNKTAADKDQEKELPTTVVTIDKCSEQSQTSSIGIGEFGMITSKKGMTKTFAMAVREHLFRMVKFLGGTNESLDYSTEPTSICALMKRHCNILDADARSWWEQQRNMLKGIHTDYRNNKIKMIKQIFTGKYIHETTQKRNHETTLTSNFASLVQGR